ncbi:hypothetical protein BDV97DRAFT_266006, partial [Delphinella strobiligena]
HLVAYFGLSSVLQWLLDYGLRLEDRDSNVEGLLDYVSKNSHEESVQMLPDKGADVNVLGGVFGDALQAASVRGYDTIVQMPLDNGAD